MSLNPTVQNACWLPREIYPQIFIHLDLYTFSKVSQVCKAWLEIVSETNFWDHFDLKKLVPTLEIIDEQVWKKQYHLNIEDAPKLDKCKIIRELTNLFKAVPVKKMACIAMLTVPKDLTYDEFIAQNLSKAPDNIQWYFKTVFGLTRYDQKVEKTYRIIMAKIYGGPSSQSVSQKLNNRDYVTSKASEEAILFNVTFATTGKNLLNEFTKRKRWSISITRKIN